MNEQLRAFAKAELKAGLSQLPESSHRNFKLMYARDEGRRSVEDALAMPIDEVVDLMPDDRLDWAMQQVQRSIAIEGR